MQDVTFSWSLPKLPVIADRMKLQMNFMGSYLTSSTNLNAIVTSDLNPQVSKTNQAERHLGGSYGVATQRTDNGERLLQLCSSNSIFSKDQV